MTCRDGWELCSRIRGGLWRKYLREEAGEVEDLASFSLPPHYVCSVDSSQSSQHFFRITGLGETSIFIHFEFVSVKKLVLHSDILAI